MLGTTEQLQQIAIFSQLPPEQLAKLQLHSNIRQYLPAEIIMHEGDRLPPKLFAVLSGIIQIKKIAATGKETILRTLPKGELFAAPALFGNGIAPATVVASLPCQILTIERTGLLATIRQTPELALAIMAVLTERLGQLHNTVHGLVSERAIVRLAQFVQAAAQEGGLEATETGLRLRSHLPYYQIARSIGITYEECVRLFRQLDQILHYRRGEIVVLDQKKLEAIACGEA
jgi:CRP/FNR family transcriptional regulator, cyclic AMP receptor protein